MDDVIYLVIPCQRDHHGKFIVDAVIGPPYGYHHIQKVRPNGASWVVAMIDPNLSEAQLFEIAAILAQGARIERVTDEWRERLSQFQKEDR